MQNSEYRNLIGLKQESVWINSGNLLGIKRKETCFKPELKKDYTGIWQ